MIRAFQRLLVRSRCASRPPEAKPLEGEFVLRTTSVSPLDRDKGRRALDPAKNAPHFSVIKKNATAIMIRAIQRVPVRSGCARRSPEAESPIRACILHRGVPSPD